jgi:short-subunit dehydrogenase
VGGAFVPLDIMRKIKGRTALVTGAASGIGEAISLALAKEGADVWLVDVNTDGLQRVAAQIQALGVNAYPQTCDLSDADAIDRLAAIVHQTTDGIDILVNNAGVCFYGSTATMSDDDWEWMLSINLRAPIALAHRFVNSMLEKEEAHIVNVASYLGLVVANRVTAYCTTKHALVGYSEALRAELARTRLGVTAICPGYVTTELFNSSRSGRPDRSAPVPPRFICTTPERIAAKTVRAIYRNKRMVVITPLAHLQVAMKRIAPGLLDWLYHLGRKRKAA